MKTVQYIENNGRREYAVVPIELWERLADQVEDLEDEGVFAQAKASDDGVRIPAAVLDAELAGVNPVRAWRDFRGLTQQVLADKAGISKAFLSQIERGKRTGRVRVLSGLAQALGVPVDLLM